MLLICHMVSEHLGGDHTAEGLLADALAVIGRPYPELLMNRHFRFVASGVSVDSLQGRAEW